MRLNTNDGRESFESLTMPLYESAHRTARDVIIPFSRLSKFLVDSAAVFVGYMPISSGMVSKSSGIVLKSMGYRVLT